MNNRSYRGRGLRALACAVAVGALLAFFPLGFPDPDDGGLEQQGRTWAGRTWANSVPPPVEPTALGQTGSTGHQA
jgi:hypothetical protein